MSSTEYEIACRGMAGDNGGGQDFDVRGHGDVRITSTATEWTVTHSPDIEPALAALAAIGSMVREAS